MKITRYDASWLWQAQFPNSKGALDDGYSHCPAPASESVREKLLELAPPSMCKFNHSMDLNSVSMWGSTGDMVRTSYEVLGLGSLRFTCKGEREITVVSLKQAEQMMNVICDKEELVPPTSDASSQSQGVPLMRLFATFLHDHLDAKGLSHLSEAAGVVAYRVTCPAGSLMYLPTGSIYSERSLNGSLVHGWRISIVESIEAGGTLQGLASNGRLGPSRILRPVMLSRPPRSRKPPKPAPRRRHCQQNMPR